MGWRNLVAVTVMGLCIGSAVAMIAPDLSDGQHLAASMLLFVAMRAVDWSART